jgi:hypothetical protein
MYGMYVCMHIFAPVAHFSKGIMDHEEGVEKLARFKERFVWGGKRGTLK